MTLSREAMLELMAYADGELDGDARVRVQALLAESAEARAVVSALETLGEVVSEVEEHRAKSDGADGIADVVLLRIAGAESQEPLLRPAPASSRVAAARDGGAAGGRATAGRRRVRASAAVGAVLAMAAAVALLVRSREAALGSLFGGRETAVVSPAGSSEASGGGVEVESLDSPDVPVSVFYQPASGGPNLTAASVVVWINEEARANGDR
jgi:hypothetical protein